MKQQRIKASNGSSEDKETSWFLYLFIGSGRMGMCRRAHRKSTAEALGWGGAMHAFRISE